MATRHVVLYTVIKGRIKQNYLDVLAEIMNVMEVSRLRVCIYVYI